MSMLSACVPVVPVQCASVDLVELTIKDHCLSRSDMWRFSNSLVSTVELIMVCCFDFSEAH